jgi:hypothetical protein
MQCISYKCIVLPGTGPDGTLKARRFSPPALIGETIRRDQMLAKGSIITITDFFCIIIPKAINKNPCPVLFPVYPAGMIFRTSFEQSLPKKQRRKNMNRVYRV